MKNFRGTIFFALIVGLILGVAIFEFKKDRDSGDQLSSKFFDDIDVNQISVIKLNGLDTAFTLEKNEGLWTLRSPVEDIASTEAVDSYLRLISDQKVEEVEVPTGSTLPVAQFGLDKPLTLELTVDGREAIIFSIGTVRSYDNGFYVRKNQENQIYLGTSGWEGVLSKKPNDLRDKTLRLPNDVLSQIKINSKIPRKIFNYELSKENNEWFLSEDKNIKLAQGLVDKMSHDLREIKANEIVSDIKNTTALKEYGLSAPAATINLIFEENKSVNVFLSNPKDGDVYITSDGIKPIFKVAVGQMDKVLKSKEEYRDKNFMFAFSTKDARQIEISSDNEKSIDIYENIDGQWKHAVKSDQKVIQAEINSFLSSVAGLKAEHFLQNDKSDLHNKIVFRNANGDVLLSLQYGASFKADTEELYKVKTTLFKDVISVKKITIDNIVKKSLFETHEMKKDDKN